MRTMTTKMKPASVLTTLGLEKDEDEDGEKDEGGEIDPDRPVYKVKKPSEDEKFNKMGEEVKKEYADATKNNSGPNPDDPNMEHD